MAVKLEGYHRLGVAAGRKLAGILGSVRGIGSSGTRLHVHALLSRSVGTSSSTGAAHAYPEAPGLSLHTHAALQGRSGRESLVANPKR